MNRLPAPRDDNLPDPDPGDAWEPAPRRRRRDRLPVWQSARLAGLLGVALVALVAVALVLPGLPAPSGAPGATPRRSGTAGGPMPLPTLSPSPTPSFVRPTPTPAPTPLAYVVASGDSLNTIARRFETTARSIAFWNRDAYPSLDPESEAYAPDRIEVGWRLMLLPGVVVGADGEPEPTRSPGPSLPPTAVPRTPAPSVPAGGPATVISSGPRGTTKIALTFDMGGRLDPAAEILRWLVDQGVRATIFPTGKQGTEQPQGRAAMAIVRDNPMLLELANHSWDHLSFTDLTAAEMRQQLDRAEAALLEDFGRTTRPWFRPPFGALNADVRRAVGAAGWSTIVMWDIDTIDWRPTSEGGPTARDIEAKVLANAQGGSIVLMHLGGWNTLDALPGILEGLRDKGLEPVTLSELLGG